MLAAMAAFRAGACAVEAAGAGMEFNRHATPPITDVHSSVAALTRYIARRRFVSFLLHQ